MNFRPYQKESIDKLSAGFLNGEKRGSLLWSTGAGKSLGTRGIFFNLQNKFTHFIIIVPSNSIKPSFAEENPSLLPIKEVNTNAAKQYISGTNHNYGIVVTHQLFMKLKVDFDCSNKILAIDEAHHAGDATELTKNIKKWLDNGGACLYVTATPTRTKGKSIVNICQPSKEMVSVRSIKDQMEDGFAPKEIDCDLIKVESKCEEGDNVIGAPIDKEKLANHIITQLYNDCWPKTIIRLKNTGNTSDNQTLINYINDAIKEAKPGIRTIMATSNEELDKLNPALVKDKEAKRLNDSTTDIIIGINAVVEGLDWPSCSHFYFVGIPRSTLLLTQSVGRTLRLKTVTDYYPGWKDKSKVTMFTGNVSNVKNKHANEIMKAICFMGSLKDWSVLSVIKNKFNNKLNDKDIPEEIIHSCNESAIPEAKEVLTKIQIYFYQNIASIKKLTNKNIIDLYRYFYDNNAAWLKDKCSEEELKFAMVMGDNDSKEKFSQKLEGINSCDKDIADKIRTVWNEVVEEFFEEDKSADDTEYGLVQTLNINKDIIESVTSKVEDAEFWDLLR